MEMLIEKLADYFSIDMGREAILSAIDKQNRFYDLLRSIGEMRTRENPPLTGGDFHRMFMAAQVCPRDLIMPMIENFRVSLEQEEGIRDYRARLLLVGGEMDDPSYIDVIESQGGLVVADRYCTGSMPGMEPVHAGDDPVRGIVDYTFKKTACPRMMEDFNGRLDTIRKIVDQYDVDGVVIEIVKFCDIWGVESSPLVAALRDFGIPVLKLEREYRFSGEGQLRTRVQAFLESMGK
jgi:benzoyl-CoA reductase/2-hydroxyglutaryl-CoA dehydratase subunit BcrC/BadD/HgdB